MPLARLIGKGHFDLLCVISRSSYGKWFVRSRIGLRSDETLLVIRQIGLRTDETLLVIRQIGLRTDEKLPIIRQISLVSDESYLVIRQITTSLSKSKKICKFKKLRSPIFAVAWHSLAYNSADVPVNSASRLIT